MQEQKYLNQGEKASTGKNYSLKKRIWSASGLGFHHEHGEDSVYDFSANENALATGTSSAIQNALVLLVD